MTATTRGAAAAPTAREERASDAFVAYVLDLCRDKRTAADLRKGLGLPVERCNWAHRYLVRRLPPRMHPDARRAHYAIAALIAARPRAARDADDARAAETAADRTDEADRAAAAVGEWWQRPTLGAALAQAVNAGALKPGSAEGELHLFTRQSTDAIHPRLPALTRHLLTSGIGIDWAVLLEDLSWWNRNRDATATRWLEGFYRTLSEPTESDHATDSQEKSA